MPAHAALLVTSRLRLTPLDLSDAREMVGVLASPELYHFTGGEPPGLEQLTERYRWQIKGSPGDETWHNWIIRLRTGNAAVGFVQATVAGAEAELAWVVGLRWQGLGYAVEAARGMMDWLDAVHGVDLFTAHIHPDHAASGRVAASLGLTLTEEVDADGEGVWSLVVP